MEAESNKMRSARAFRPHKKRKSEVNEDESPKQLEVKKPQRKSGKLAGLISLPFDLLFEVSHFYVQGTRVAPKETR